MPLVEQAQIGGRGETMTLVLPQGCSKGTDRRCGGVLGEDYGSGEGQRSAENVFNSSYIGRRSTYFRFDLHVPDAFHRFRARS